MPSAASCGPGGDGRQRDETTGTPIDSNDIVKGIQQDDGDYVALSDEQMKAAYPKTTQTIEIEASVQAMRSPSSAGLVFNTIRWADEVRPLDELKLPAQGKDAAAVAD